MAVTPLGRGEGGGVAALGGEAAVAPSAVNGSSASTAATRRCANQPTFPRHTAR